MTMLHAGNELVISGDGKRQIYEDLSNVLALPHARVIAEDGMEVTLPPDAAAPLRAVLDANVLFPIALCDTLRPALPSSITQWVVRKILYDDRARLGHRSAVDRQ